MAKKNENRCASSSPFPIFTHEFRVQSPIPPKEEEEKKNLNSPISECRTKTPTYLCTVEPYHILRIPAFKSPIQHRETTRLGSSSPPTPATPLGRSRIAHARCDVTRLTAQVSVLSAVARSLARLISGPLVLPHHTVVHYSVHGLKLRAWTGGDGSTQTPTRPVQL